MVDSSSELLTAEQLLLALHARRRLFGGILAAIGVLTLLVAVVLPRRYEAVVVVAPVESTASAQGIGAITEQFGEIASLLGVSGVLKSEEQVALAILKSRAFAEEFIRKYGLTNALLEPRGPLAKLSTLLGRKPPNIHDAVRVFDEDVRAVFEDSATGLVRLRILWHDPEVAAGWANSFVADANTRIRARRLAELDANLAYLNGELKKTDVVELRSAIYRLIEEQIKARMVAQSMPEYAFRSIDPAVAADPSDPVEPRRLLILILGTGFAIFIAIAAVVVTDVFVAGRRMIQATAGARHAGSRSDTAGRPVDTEHVR